MVIVCLVNLFEEASVQVAFRDGCEQDHVCPQGHDVRWQSCVERCPSLVRRNEVVPSRT